MIFRITTLLVILLVGGNLIMQTGCGGGNPARLAEGGISGTGFTTGPLSGFGSIISNGIHFNTDSALVNFNGTPGTTDMLEVGMVVTVDGQFDTTNGSGVASDVGFEYLLVGEVEAVTDVIEVLGQAVSVNNQTLYKNTASGQLAVGDHVAVSGLISANGSIRATYAEKIPPPAEHVVTGLVTGLDAGAGTFRILNLNRQVTGGIGSTLPQQLVDFSQALQSNFPDTTPVDGDLVRVTGVLNGSVLEAGLVSNRQTTLDGSAGDNFLLQGLVRAFDPGSYIQLNGYRIQVGATTAYVNTTATALSLDDTLQVEGTLDSGGNLLAHQVIRLDRPTVTLDAHTESLDPSTGTIVVLGLQIETNLYTLLEDNSSAALKPFSLQDIAAGDRLIVNGYVGASGIVATSVERIDSVAGSDVSITGKINLLPGDPLFEVAGLQVDTSGLPDSSGFLEGQLAITRGGFFQALRRDMVVEARGSYNGSDLIPSTVKIPACCNFGLLTSDGTFVGGISDIVTTWNGVLYSDPATQTTPNMTLASASSMQFFGFPMVIHDVRVFGPGSYTFNTTRGNTLNLDIGPGQMGAHLLLDWNNNLDMDTVILWEIDGVYTGSIGSGNDLGAKDFLFNLAAIDGDGDGIPGIALADGPFTGMQPVLNVNLTTP